MSSDTEQNHVTREELLQEVCVYWITTPQKLTDAILAKFDVTRKAPALPPTVAPLPSETPTGPPTNPRHAGRHSSR